MVGKWPGPALKKDIARPNWRGRHFSYDVRLEARVHQSHGYGSHHKSFPADAVADNATGGLEFSA